MNSLSPNPHKRVQRSTTLNRKYVKRPVKTPKIKTTAELHAENLKRRQALAARMSHGRLLKASPVTNPKKTSLVPSPKLSTPIKKHPLEASARAKLAAPSSLTPKKPLSMREKKELAIKSALKTMAETSAPQERKTLHKSFFSFKRVAFALFLAIFVVGVAAYLIRLSMPNLSVKVAAMQTGIDAIYPSFVPKGFSLSDITADAAKISLKFTSSENSSYIITEEKSSWNSSALEENYIKPNFQKQYSTVREQGLTIFISGPNCAWVNGGKLFTISSDSELTKTQLVSIATSL